MDSIPQFLIAAPTSGSGKTTVSRGLMALFVKKGLKVQPFKCGPDYIDTKYHEAVCGRPSINLDTFMASPEHVGGLYARYSADADVAVVEGMMGMYDGYDREPGLVGRSGSALGYSCGAGGRCQVGCLFHGSFVVGVHQFPSGYTYCGGYLQSCRLTPSLPDAAGGL